MAKDGLRASAEILALPYPVVAKVAKMGLKTEITAKRLVSNATAVLAGDRGTAGNLHPKARVAKGGSTAVD